MRSKRQFLQSGKSAATESYIAIAARTFGLCAAGAFILPEILCDAGLVMMYKQHFANFTRACSNRVALLIL